MTDLSFYTTRAKIYKTALLSNIGLMNSLSVRNATSSDLEKLVELRLSLQRHAEKSNSSVWRITKEGKRLLRQKLEKTLMESNNCMVVAEMSGEVVGFANGQVTHRTDYLPESVGAISTIFVTESFRRRGVGRRMVEKLCQFFIREKVEQITLRYIIGNIEAEGFWSELGFEQIITTASISPEELKERLAR